MVDEGPFVTMRWVLVIVVAWLGCQKAPRTDTPAPEPDAPAIVATPPPTVDAAVAPPPAPIAPDAAIAAKLVCKPKFSACSCSWTCARAPIKPFADCARACPNQGSPPQCTVLDGKCAVAR